MSAEHYSAAVEAERLASETDIALLPAVIERKLAFYDACFDLATQHGDRHGANNWAHARLMAKHVRDMRAAQA